jgi:hypothetical protein
MQNRRLSARGPTVALTDNGRFGTKRKAGSRPAATAERRKRPIQFRNSLPDDISTICVTAIQARSMRELFRELIDGADVEPEYNV